MIHHDSQRVLNQTTDKEQKELSMIQYIYAYIATAVVFLIIDIVWLSQIATRFYADRLGDLLLERPNMGVALGFYLIYIAGIVIFAVAPALKSGSLYTAIVFGSLFGFFAYATYDLTNLATLKNWSAVVSFVDLIWGTILTGVAAGSGYAVTTAVLNK